MTLNSQFTVGPVTTPLVSISGSVDGGHGGVLPAIGAAVVLVGHLLLSEAVMGQDHAPGAARAHGECGGCSNALRLTNGGELGSLTPVPQKHIRLLVR